DYLRESLEIAEKSRLWELQELSQMALGQRYYELGDYDTAIAYFEKVVEIHKKVKDKNKLAMLYFGIGSFYACKDDKKMALDYYQKVMELFESWADEEQISNFFNNVWILANQSDSPKQIILSLKLLKARLRKSPPSYKLARLHGTLGRIYQELIQRPTLAISYLRQGIKLLAVLNRTQEQVQAITNLAVLYEQQGYYQLALDADTEALCLAETNNFEEEVARLLYNRANCFTLIEMWEQGEADYNRALSIAEKQDDIELKQAIFHNLGETYSRWGKFERAIALLNRSLEFSRQKEDIDDQILAMNNLGIAYRKNEQYQEAIECSNQALALSRKYYKKRDEARILITLGNAIRFQDKLEEAKVYYEKSLAVARTIGDISLEQDSFLSLAYVHHELGTLDSLEAEFQDVV
ncbi:MAG: tetratricopeptide repeat protein, partial [Bacteroidota bacterium]